MMINIIYKLRGETELKITQKQLEKLSTPELFRLAKAEQDKKIKIIILEA